MATFALILTIILPTGADIAILDRDMSRADCEAARAGAIRPYLPELATLASLAPGARFRMSCAAEQSA